jgi:hypothetical protein
MMSFLETSGNVARIVGPPLSVLAYTAARNHTFIIMPVLAGISLCALLGLWGMRRAAEAAARPMMY